MISKLCYTDTMDKQQKTEDRYVIRLPLGTLARIKNVATRHKRSINQEMAWAIEEYLQEQEKAQGETK